ncbi:MAG: hypothetical protein WC497_04855 [Patescibacteria group bacterium]
MQVKSLMYRLATFHVTMRGGRIPSLVLITALLPVVLGALVCAPPNPIEHLVTREQATFVLQAVAQAQNDQLESVPLYPAPGITGLVPVCPTKGAEVWTVFDGGVRNEQTMRRMVWTRFPSTGRRASPFSDPSAFQPMDDIGNQPASKTCPGIAENVRYVWYNVDLAPSVERHFRIWGDHWYLEVQGASSGQYRLSIAHDRQGRRKAEDVSSLIERALAFCQARR